MNPPLILISIKQQYAEAILDGTKTVEFRKISFPKRVGTMVLYATSPVKKIVGLVKVRAVVVLSPEGAWRKYHKRGAIDRRSFNAYYAGSKKAVCLELENPPPAAAGGVTRISPHPTPPGAKAPGVRAKFVKAYRFRRPVDPKKADKGFRAPQSFRYLRAQVYVTD